MDNLSALLRGLEVGEALAHKNLALFPLLGGAEGDPGYLTLDEAATLGTVHVTEVSAGGHVPELSVRNSGKAAVLLLDGEELVGAKQNRILNLTILVPAGASLAIPVSCVEQGRWSWRSEGFAPSGRAQFSKGRARKVAQVTQSLRSHGARVADQADVWEGIAQKMDRMDVTSGTGAMSDLYESRGAVVEDFVRAIPLVPGQCGAVFALDGAVAGLELFDAHRTFARALPKLLRSYALDAIETLAPHKRVPKAPTAAKAQALLQAVREAPASFHPALGEGRDARFGSPGATGAALVARERVIHLLAFVMNGEGREGSKPAGSRIHRRVPRPNDPNIID